MKISRYLISALLICLAFSVQGQEEDSVVVKPKKIDTLGMKKFIPTGIRFGMDLISLGSGVVKNGLPALTQGDVRQWKFNADIDVYRYFLNFEYGILDRQWEDPSLTSIYNNKGYFFKLGPDINFLHRDPDQSALFIGFRYAKAKYDDDIVYNYNNTYWGSGVETGYNRNLESEWYELTTGLKVKLYKFIWAGYTARFKFSVSNNFSGNDLAPHWIPGYGRAAEESRWGFEYWLIFRIPFKEYIPAPKKED